MKTRSQHEAEARGTGVPGTAKMVRRASWGVADQVLNSGSNFAMGIVVARSFPLNEFGAYALVFAAYSLGLGVSRALSTEPYAVRFSVAAPAQARAAARACTGTALLIGLACALLTAAAAMLMSGQALWLALALAVSFPGLLLQDSWRQVFFSTARGRAAFFNDALWLVYMVPGFAIVIMLGSVSVAAFVFAWGMAGTLAALTGMLQSRSVPSVRRAVGWIREHRQLWSRFLGENLAVNGAQQALFAAIAAVAGMTALGQIKLAQLALGPVLVLSQGIGVIAVPEAARALKSGAAAVRRARIGASALVASGAAMWGLALFLLPHQWTTAVVGSHWLAAAALVIPLTLVQVFNGLRTGDAMMLRAMGQAHRGFLTRATTSALLAAGGVLGAVAGGALTAAWGMAIAAALSSWIWGIQYRKGSKIHSAALSSDAVLIGKGMPA